MSNSVHSWFGLRPLYGVQSTVIMYGGVFLKSLNCASNLTCLGCIAHLIFQ
jgi:hypothetical protein